MPKKLLMASVHVPDSPRVRFFVHTGDKTTVSDITHRVVKLVIEDPEDQTGYCSLLRLDGKNQLVWKTRHPSLQEIKWHAEFEYGLPEEKWLTFSECCRE